jgi:hypothetical protein
MTSNQPDVIFRPAVNRFPGLGVDWIKVFSFLIFVADLT